MRYVLSIDAGTTGITVLAVGEDARIHASGYREFPQYFPQPGWVEHDADEIWTATCEATQDALAEIDPADLVAIGITNQRETVVIWERSSSRPAAKAIVWQCRRTAERCEELKAAGSEPTIREVTGLVADAYFSGTKIEWLLDNIDGLRARAENGDVAFGTIDTWLVWKLTGGRVHATDPSNASRTMLFDIRSLQWSDEMCALLHVPTALLPEVKPSSGRFGTTDPDAFCGLSLPISGIAGDQQAALFGQGCYEAGRSKNTYGTGSFLLLNAGSTPPPVQEGFLSTVAWTVDGRTDYALEGAIFITGAALNWLRDGLQIIDDFAGAEPLASSVPDTDGVTFVPAFVGLGSPYWDPYARGTITGLTRGTSRAHIVRAAIEAMAQQSQDVLEAMGAALGSGPKELRVDGGATRMDLLCQLQADLSGIPVVRPVVRETTALGAAFLAGLAEGVWDGFASLESAWGVEKRFEPVMESANRAAHRERWRRAVERARGWDA
jgi:glycerol kinase